MDSLAHYRKLIKQIIQRYAALEAGNPDIRVEMVFDETNDHYALVESGWEGHRRIEGQVIHVDIINGKFWIQHDGTEDGVTPELEELGVPRKDIVLAFHSPAKRALTDYAVG